MNIPNEITDIIDAATRHELSAQTVARLAESYARSGSRTQFSGRTADIPSTGGPSSLSTLLSPLMLTVAGFKVPKLAVPGRPAGGIDVLAQLSGYRINLRAAEIMDVIEKCGYAHFVAGPSVAPLDARTFQLRKKMGAQAVPDLVIASLLSKKLAVDVRHVCLDVRVAPHGNFGATFEEANRYSRKFISVAKLLGIDAVCVLTDGRFPFQPFIGRGEALWALALTFNSDSCLWLTQHVEQVWKMTDELAGKILPRSNYAIMSAFQKNVEAQGSNMNSLFEIAKSVSESHLHVLDAPDAGYVSYDLDALRTLLVGFQRASGCGKDFPDPGGVRLLAMSGRTVDRGQPIISLRLPQADWEGSRKAFMDAIRISQDVAGPEEDRIVHG